MGYDIDYLKSVVRPFKAVHKPLVFGAFGLTKERDVAIALNSGNCKYDSKGTTCIIWKELKRKSVKKDFRGTPFKYNSGSEVITNFATSDYDVGLRMIITFLNKARERTGDVYAEIFEEDTVAKKIISKLGFIWNTTKISAGSEIIGIYKYRDKVVDISEKELHSLCKADLLGSKYGAGLSSCELTSIRKELRGCEHYAQHYSNYNKRKSWTAFSVRGYIKNDPGFIIKPNEMSMRWKSENGPLLDNFPEWTVISHYFPETVKVAKRFGLLDRVRFMKLAAGGELSRHADIIDRGAGVGIGKVMRFHIPIYSNKGIVFYSWDARGKEIELSFSVGEVYYLDQRKPHRVTNNSNEDRIHLVIDAIQEGE